MQRKRYFMQHADDGFAAGDQRFSGQEPVGLMRRVQVGQRFIHQQHLSLNGQRTRQQHALAFTTRQLPERPAPPVPGVGGAQRFFDGGMVVSAGRCQPGLVRQAA